MTTDLIKRLRQHALPDPHDEREVLHAPLLREAADTLEAVGPKIAELEADNATLRADIETRHAREFELLADNTALRHDLGRCLATSAELATENAELRKAGK